VTDERNSSQITLKSATMNNAIIFLLAGLASASYHAEEPSIRSLSDYFRASAILRDIDASIARWQRTGGASTLFYLRSFTRFNCIISLPLYVEAPCDGGDDCCTLDGGCGLFEGDCDSDADCLGRLVCGSDNCGFWTFGDDCCALSEEDEGVVGRLGLTETFRRSRRIFERR